MKKKKNTEFYLLRKKSLSEADLFVTDYIKTKKRLEILESEFSVIRNIVINQGTYVDDKKKHWYSRNKGWRSSWSWGR